MSSFLPDKGGSVSERLVAYHAAREKSGFGMNTVETTVVHPTSKASPRGRV